MRQLFQHRVFRNAGAMGVVQVVNYIAPFVVLVYLTRILGVSTYGVVAFAIGITQVAAVLLDLGFTLGATQKISVFRDRKHYVARLVGAVLSIKLAAFALVASVIVAYAVCTEKYATHSALLLLTTLPLLGHTLQPVWFFSGIERMRYLTLFLVTAKLVFVALVFLLVKAESDYLWVPVADGVAQIVAGVIALQLVYRVGYRIAAPRWREVRYALKMTMGFFVSRVSVTAYTNSGVLLLGLLAAPVTVAVYSLADQLYKAIQSLFAPVVQALFPYMAKERDLLLLRRVATGCVVVAVVGSIVGHFVAPQLIRLMFGPEWKAVLPVLDVFLIAVPVHVLTVMSGYPLAAALDRLDVANRSVIYGTLLYVALAGGLLLAGLAAPTAFAWLMIVSESYVLVHRVVALWPAAFRQYSQRLAEAARA